MSSTKGRRTHTACVMRMRETCPFRKMRRGQCCESPGRRWRNSCDQPGVPAASPCGGGMEAVYVETCPPSPTTPQRPHPHTQAAVAMDSDIAPLISGPMFSSFSSSLYSVSSASTPMNFHQSGLSSSDASMDLDSAVDPETGERAQG
ncbi:uncharacterized protein LOC143491497 [Brachyhypopomus gauderio]|uniref:uncharacterized protein LOC143491497 n=1 Tax=Brachyhypopomus gauderio TaxID=698409 RepID=UPI0040412EBA